MVERCFAHVILHTQHFHWPKEAGSEVGKNEDTSAQIKEVSTCIPFFFQAI